MFRMIFKTVTLVGESGAWKLDDWQLKELGSFQYYVAHRSILNFKISLLIVDYFLWSAQLLGINSI